MNQPVLFIYASNEPKSVLARDLGVAKRQWRLFNIKVYFDGDQDAKEVFAEVIAQKIRDTKTKDKLAIMKDKQYNDYEFSNLKSA